MWLDDFFFLILLSLIFLMLSEFTVKFFIFENILFRYFREVTRSQMLNDILWTDHIQWQPPTDQTLYRTRPFTEFWVVSIEHLRRVWHADRGRLLLRTPGPVPLGLAYVLLVETNPFPKLSLFFRTLLFEYPWVLSRFYFFFSPPAHLCAVTCMTEISLIVTLNNQFTSPVPFIIFDSVFCDRWRRQFCGKC